MTESNEFVPILSLNSIDQPILLKRCKTLIEKFKSLYNNPPDFIARAPGRVNLIGEHIDYAGFGVLPMAISNDVIIAVNFSNKKGYTNVRLSNIIDDKYKQKSWDFEGKDKIVEIIVEEGVSEWSNYFKCGYKGILRHLGIENPVGMDCLMDGIVPIGAGLSSSSSFVCCAALATSHANNAKLTKKQITEISIECERFAGMNSGGMDQTASIFSQFGHALYVEFLPTLNATPTKLPTTNSPITFVVANSLVKADKVITAPIHYNLRVVETKLAAYHLGQLLFGEGCENLKHLCDLYSKSTKVTIDNLEKLSDYVDQVYKKNQNGYTLEELSVMLKLSSTEIYDKFIAKFPVRAERFHLYKRSKHVFEESCRVLKFYKVCTSGNNMDDIKVFESLGNLMNQSHQSCKELFDCSCDELNDLVKICLDGGAFGSRLTGAGWGGCTVSLISEDNVEKFIQHVVTNYYNLKFPSLSKNELNDAIFVTKPSNGAMILKDLLDN